ncbi:uncharacterized protein LOC111699114 [Eurytemora carolleeae]|uniref:uncharacterized protein LOC111699114 n=1 Tax=Eurytemora carolleeae TaxID=1294199 RepID=UPI000C76928B|nr:uncharacterized protein LOC111699114 [Eurytemora carolleeae]|eukprot:XP_023325454.1 uncharacterized protein LOC111699114 [Eurytemora affinis]
MKLIKIQRSEIRKRKPSEPRQLSPEESYRLIGDALHYSEEEREELELKLKRSIRYPSLPKSPFLKNLGLMRQEKDSKDEIVTKPNPQKRMTRAALKKVTE